MKKIDIFLLTIFIACLFTGCEKDNYKAPASFISGNVVYQDNPVQVRNARVQLELWQAGFARPTKIPVYVNQDGGFSANVFDGTYKLVLLRGSGPWVPNSDTINVNSGASDVKVPVTPYFLITAPQITKSGNTVTASFGIQKIVSTANVEYAVLCLGSTQIVDRTNNAGATEKAAAALNATGTQTITMNIPAALENKGYFYARIGVKTAGAEELIYSPVQKL